MYLSVIQYYSQSNFDKIDEEHYQQVKNDDLHCIPNVKLANENRTKLIQSVQ